MTKIKGLSLFANVGIAEALFSDIGIDILVANEIDKKRRFEENSKKVYSWWITLLTRIYDTLHKEWNTVCRDSC